MPCEDFHYIGIYIYLFVMAERFEQLRCNLQYSIFYVHLMLYMPRYFSRKFRHFTSLQSMDCPRKELEAWLMCGICYRRCVLPNLVPSGGPKALQSINITVIAC